MDDHQLEQSEKLSRVRIEIGKQYLFTWCMRVCDERTAGRTFPRYGYSSGGSRGISKVDQDKVGYPRLDWTTT